jgi:hypothetical protein
MMVENWLPAEAEPVLRVSFLGRSFFSGNAEFNGPAGKPEKLIP